MFTGLIEETGIVKALKPIGAGAMEITVGSQRVIEDVKLGDSICLNGVCQTVTSFGRGYFVVTAVEETIKKSAFRLLKINDRVNLERSATLNSRLGGHIVLGHADTVGKITSINKLLGSTLIEILFDTRFSHYVVEEGSIAVDGISLTVARISGDSLTVSVIPHSLEHTTLRERKAGDLVNLEFDILGKYVARMMNRTLPDSSGQTGSGTTRLPTESGITEEFLRKHGF